MERIHGIDKAGAFIENERNFQVIGKKVSDGCDGKTPVVAKGIAAR